MRQNAAVCTNAQALWRQPQTNRTVRIERRENKTPKNKKRPLPQSPLPLSGKGRGEAQKHASAGEEFGQRQERGQRRMGKGDSTAAFKGGVGAEGEREDHGFSTRCRRRTKTVPNIPFLRRQMLRATDAKNASKRRVFHSKTSLFFATIGALSFKTSRVFFSAFCRLDLPAFRFGGTARNA